MDYCAGWGNRTNRDGTAPAVLNIHLWGREMVPCTVSSLLGGGGGTTDMEPVFRWHPKKAWSNLRKHGVSFEEAASVFRDTLSVTIADPLHSGEEDRFVTIGQSARNRTLVVVHLEVQDAIRIISARTAAPRERSNYEEGAL